MPWLPMYLTDPDATVLIDILVQDPEIAFLVSDGPKRWRAVKDVVASEIDKVALWHVPSGPLPLLASAFEDPDQHVQDPWLGWTEERTGADPDRPYFGAGHPGIIWLNLCTSPKDQGSCCGLSSFSWIGNHYRIIGSPAMPSTEAWWKSLRRRVVKLSDRVPRQQLSSLLPAEIFAFPCAYALLKAGDIADLN